MSGHPIVVVGAGIAGATVAWHLARRGVAEVVVLEQEQTPGVHSTGRNAAFVRAWTEEEAWRGILAEGARVLRGAEHASFARIGCLLLGMGDEDVARRVPLARGKARWCPDDGVVDVAGLLAAYLRGSDVRLGCRLLAWRREAGHLRLETTGGPLAARVLVNAAGPWAGPVGRIPLAPLRRHVFVTAPSPAVDPRWPFVWDVPHGLYFRPESGGLLLSPCDEDPGEPGDYHEDALALETLAERVERLQPGIADLVRIRHRWVGQRTFAADRAPVLGFDPREPLLFHVAGLGGHGVTSAPAVGRLAADLLLERGPAPRAFRPDRLLG